MLPATFPDWLPPEPGAGGAGSAGGMVVGTGFKIFVGGTFIKFGTCKVVGFGGLSCVCAYAVTVMLLVNTIIVVNRFNRVRIDALGLSLL